MFDSTPIENMFLLEYLPHLPDDCVRVYLYARMLCYHPEMGGDLAEIGKALHLDEDAVLEAFHCLEQQGLVEKMSDRPPTFSILPLNKGVIVQENSIDRRNRDFNFAALNILGVTSIGHKQSSMLYDWLDVLGYTQEAALKILEYEKQVSAQFTPNTIIKRADRRAIEWAERGIHSLEDVQRAISYDDRVYSMAYAVLKQLAIPRKPTDNELDCVRRWVNEWKLSEEDVLSACVHTTKSRNPSIAYLDAILKARAESGADRHFEDLKLILKELGASNNVPTPDQVKKYADLLEQGFEAEAVMLAAVQCARKRKHSFEELEWMIGKWGEAGVRTRTQAQKYVTDMQQATAHMRDLLEAAGLSRRPNMDDLEKYELWKQKHSPELIACAAECARGTRVPVKYMDKLLSEWEKSGVTTPEAARKQHAQAVSRPMSSTTVAKPNHLNYQQRPITDQTYGKDSYSDPTKSLE